MINWHLRLHSKLRFDYLCSLMRHGGHLSNLPVGLLDKSVHVHSCLLNPRKQCTANCNPLLKRSTQLGTAWFKKKATWYRCVKKALGPHKYARACPQTSFAPAQKWKIVFILVLLKMWFFWGGWCGYLYYRARNFDILTHIYNISCILTACGNQTLWTKICIFINLFKLYS